MCNNARIKTFTIIEILIVCGLIAAVLGVLLMYYLNTRQAKEKLSKEQELARLQVMLFARLKKDIRSAVSLKKTGDSHIFQIFAEKKSGKPELETVTWSLGPNKKKIIRAGKQRRIYDFSKFAKKRKVIFDIQ
ncbi:type II secretion system protein J [Candidatus Riflebacteria bacterium]